MSKKIHRTKTQKIKSAQRVAGFSIKNSLLENNRKREIIREKSSEVDRNYFRHDLTKTVVLTMLVLALELALWQYLSRH